MSIDKKGLIVIEPNNGNDENIFLIAEESWFEKMPLSDTYGNYGQKVDNGEAGDYLYLSTEKSVEVANKWQDEEGNEARYTLGELVAAHENGQLFDYIEKNCAEDEIDLNKSEVLGYTFWDGHNFKTETIETDDYEPTFKRIDDEKENAILKEYFEFDDYESFGAGCQKAIGEEFVFFKSQWQGEWQLAKAEYKQHEEID